MMRILEVAEKRAWRTESRKNEWSLISIILTKNGMTEGKTKENRFWWWKKLEVSSKQEQKGNTNEDHNEDKIFPFHWSHQAF